MDLGINTPEAFEAAILAAEKAGHRDLVLKLCNEYDRSFSAEYRAFCEGETA